MPPAYGRERQPEGKPEALEGMLVIDLSYANFSGIIAGTFFGEAGAEVIRIEPPQRDPARVMSPYGVKSKPAPLSQDSLLLPF